MPVRCDRCLMDSDTGTLVAFKMGEDTYSLCWGCMVRVAELWCLDHEPEIVRLRAARAALAQRGV